MKINKDSISYCLSTISKNPINSFNFPESRFCVHRGFVNERRQEDDISPNPNQSDQVGNSMMICTDIRSPKINQLLNLNEKIQTGQPASICWWFPESGEQYRIRVLTYVIPPPSLKSNFPKFVSNQKLNPPNLGSIEFDWEMERQRVFEKLSSELKSSFLRSKPGERFEKVPKEELPKTYWPTELKNEEEKNKALDRFALVLLDPISIDL
ncbi:pyridoxamine 5'-phosphate oxidase-domain-containing protein [Melampsora americana]|nr:pyridoxamine 5'-phosphate oxidase-domain-containing protein [Melampsora americana]